MNELQHYFRMSLAGGENFPEILAYAAVIIPVVIFIITFVFLFAGVTSVVERKIAGRIQSRMGPNYVGLHGFLQFIADGLKSLQKEDIIPAKADTYLFKLAPYVLFTGMLAGWAVIPFGMNLIAADLNVGILYLMSVSSLNVIGLLMAGWGSNNKWALLGGFRAAAQILSYEIPSALAALTVILLTGSLSLQQIIHNQGTYPWQWNITGNPFTAISFFILFASLLAEGNRTPFDLPESESELVAGYNTEYSGMRFLFFYLAEWANLYIISAVLTALYLGGWNSPFSYGFHMAGKFIEITGSLIFFFKSLFIVFIIILIRWTLPRLRFDQLLSLSWKYFMPISFFCIAGVLVWMLVFPHGSPVTSYAITAIFVFLFLLFLFRVVYNNLILMKAKIGFSSIR